MGAAVGVPLLVVAVAVVAYVMWNRLRKRPEKKRFSAVRFLSLSRDESENLILEGGNAFCCRSSINVCQ